MKLLVVCFAALVCSVAANSHTTCGHLNAYQSTTGTWGNIKAYATLAIDSNTNTDWFKGKSCTHTAPNDADPYLTIDLGCEKKIKSVQIFNRKDCCTGRLNDFEIVLTNQPYTLSSRCIGSVCNHYPGKLPAGKNELACAGSARFVTIRYKSPEKQPAAQRYLHICELIVIPA